MLAVIKNEARDNDDVTNEALKAAEGYIGIYVTIASIPDILIPLGKYLKKLKGSNNISPMREEQALFSSSQEGQDRSEALDRQSTDVRRVGRSASDDSANIQKRGQNVSSDEEDVTDTTKVGLATTT